jgi:hypothetical protein
MIAAGIAAVLALGTGGYFANEWRVCTGLETDYLNAMSSIRGYSAMKQVLSDQELLSNAKSHEQTAWKASEAALLGLYGRCGQRSAETAVRKGQDVLLGISTQ